jgi:hypothetical protein
MSAVPDPASATERGRDLVRAALAREEPLSPAVRVALVELLDSLDSAAEVAAAAEQSAWTASYSAGVLDSLLLCRARVLAELADTHRTREPSRRADHGARTTRNPGRFGPRSSSARLSSVPDPVGE